MRNKKPSVGLMAALTIFTFTLFLSGTRAVAQEKVLLNFSGKNGDAPYGSLILDAAGNLYGTTIDGGGDVGAVFELTPTGGGAWTEKLLRSFHGGPDDGAVPLAGLIFDAAGNLYGTTAAGGTGSSCGFSGCGTVFELTPAASGLWTRKILYSFGENSKDGFEPFGSLIFDAHGNIYGTTYGGGGVAQVCSNSSATGCGTVFELTPKAGGGWSEKVLHSFGNGTDGRNPYSNLFLDAAGNLYGTTLVGGTGSSCSDMGCGTVFELTPKAGGGWAEKVIHNFTNNGKDGFLPFSSLIFDAAGNLYSTTGEGGIGGSSCNSSGCGTVFELTRRAGGGWAEKVIHDFTNNGKDGFQPIAGLIFDAAGNLFGATSFGGTYAKGTVFKLSPATGGSWAETVLHSFGNGNDGRGPESTLILDAAGNLFGPTLGGGTYAKGTVFEIKR
jgi:uncharacterized repeat protein (TIGR03803 family)